MDYLTNRKVGMVSLGCDKNRVDAEVMLGILKKAGFEIVNNPEEADIIIINTCCFIEPAKEESIEAILEQAVYKIKGNCRLLIVTGCLAERYKHELLDEIPEVDAVVGTAKYKDILNIIKNGLKGERPVCTGDIHQPLDDGMPRVITTGPATAYLKIAEGCNNVCSYCIIPKLRGSFRSRSLEGLIDEADHLVSQGAREIILVAQDITRYGQDLKGDINLVKLLRRLCEIRDLKWIRLLYSYPDRISDELLETIAAEKKICNYLDIPIQHVHPRILKRMNRGFSQTQVIELLERIRKRMPDAIVRTSLIVGFPGEGEEEFIQLRDFIAQNVFNRIGVFTYSREEGTPAANYEGQVDEDTKEERKAELMMIQQKITRKLNRQRVGKTYDVLVESKDSSDVYIGRSYGEAPQIDGQIFIISSDPLRIGDFAKVKITKAYQYDLLGENHESSQ